MLRIKGAVQEYEWGKIGKESRIFNLLSDASYSEKHLAELWMGSHPNGPAIIFNSQAPLSSILDAKTLSQQIFDLYKDLPFLLKVLSVGKALSIQAHPDKTLAAKLFAQFPNIYKDANHKPEMAIALTPFEALVGFRPISQIQAFIKEYSEFGSIFANKQEFLSLSDSSKIGDVKAALKNLFSDLMHSDSQIISDALSEMKQDELVLRLNTQYPGDIGVFCSFFLNHVVLKPGQAVYLAANIPHAYLSGDCIECMASSDNVVRSGLTPKFKDVETLVSMLTYSTSESVVLEPSSFNSSKFTVVYDPPIEEFTVLYTRLKASEKEFFQGLKGPSILLVIQGAGSIVALGSQNEEFIAKEGFIYFIPYGLDIEISGGSDDFGVFRAFC